MLPPILVTPPSDMAVSLSEAKDFCVIEGDDEDVLVSSLIVAATNRLQRTLGLILMDQVWRQEFGAFCDRLYLPFRPIKRATIAVSYFDATDEAQVLAVGQYRVGHDFDGTFVRLAVGASWPSSFDRLDAVAVEFEAGFGGYDDIPEDLKLAIKTDVAFLYANREARTDRTITPTGAYEFLVAPYRDFYV